MSTLRHESDYPLVVGAYTAAEWTLQLTDVRPLARARLTDDDVVRLAVADDPDLVHPADHATISDEVIDAIAVLEHRRPGDDSLALGVYVWLAWWLGYRDLPEQLIPASDAFEELRAG